LVTISAHLYNPANPKGGGLRDQGVDLSGLLAPDGETHTRWMQELDLMADIPIESGQIEELMAQSSSA